MCFIWFVLCTYLCLTHIKLNKNSTRLSWTHAVLKHILKVKITSDYFLLFTSNYSALRSKKVRLCGVTCINTSIVIVTVTARSVPCESCHKTLSCRLRFATDKNLTCRSPKLISTKFPDYFMTC